MNIYMKNDIFTIELVDKNEREAMNRVISGIPTGPLVTAQFTYDMMMAIHRKLEEVSGK